MRELVTQIARALVDDPHCVTVSEIGASRTRVLELKVAKSDVGKIIGRQGRTANAMRTIVNAVSSKLRQRTILEIIE